MNGKTAVAVLIVLGFIAVPVMAHAQGVSGETGMTPAAPPALAPHVEDEHISDVVGTAPLSTPAGGSQREPSPRVSDVPVLVATSAPAGVSAQPVSVHVSDAPATTPLSTSAGGSEQAVSAHVSDAPGSMTPTPAKAPLALLY